MAAPMTMTIKPATTTALSAAPFKPRPQPTPPFIPDPSSDNLIKVMTYNKTKVTLIVSGCALSCMSVYLGDLPMNGNMVLDFCHNYQDLELYYACVDCQSFACDEELNTPRMGYQNATLATICAGVPPVPTPHNTTTFPKLTATTMTQSLVAAAGIKPTSVTEYPEKSSKDMDMEETLHIPHGPFGTGTPRMPHTPRTHRPWTAKMSLWVSGTVTKVFPIQTVIRPPPVPMPTLKKSTT
ncbi:hypothetical protein HDU76_003702 [Blyttiomyces sp. JEL0837]|nr:hypothetical protein HDU76_003702 [Blyttiomyces sp. JEL0837]